MKRRIALFALFSLVLGILPGSTFASKEVSPLTVNCNDSIAGYETEISLKTLKETDVSLMLITPQNRKVYFTETSDSNGRLEHTVSEYHTQYSGEYEVAARFADREESYGQSCLFTVYPGEVSPLKSVIKTDSKTAEAGLVEHIIAEVQLADDYLNPIKGHTVELLSSRAEDEVQLLSPFPYTDDEGKIAFLVTSESPGVSTLSAVDLTADAPIDNRAKIAFIEQDDFKAIGGDDFGMSSNYDYDNYYDDASIFLTSINTLGGVYEFKIDMDDEVDLSQAISATVTAVDELGNIVPNYTGTIRFSSTDDNASLPQDYTFNDTDLGAHEFSLGFTFKAEGEQTLSVNDIDNFSLKGERVFTAVSTDEPEEAVASEINITSPIAGTYSTGDLRIQGNATPKSMIQLFDGDLVVEEFESDDVGTFEFELKDVEEGNHAFKVRTGEGEAAAESEVINVVIDTTAPVIESFEVSPEAPIEPESELTVTMLSEMGLSKSTLLFGDQFIELTESLEAPGTYTALFTAPSEGEYSLDLVLQDEVGNEGSFPNQSSLVVTATEEETIAPTQVTEIDAREEDGRVTLTWAAAEDDTYISNYKVTYGMDPERMYFDATTFDSSTTWYIPNLENEQLYYFGIQGVDSDGNLGAMSEFISATPRAPEEELPASLGDPIILEELPEKTPETGPELWMVIIASLLLVDIYYRSRARA